MRVTLIHNPGAGGRHADGHTLLELLEAEGYEAHAVSADAPDWKDALLAPADLVVVAGGDGTVARVAKAMAGRGVPVAPLPAGTANNIARSLGLVERPWEELIRGWRQARRVKLDVGIAKGPWGEQRFIEGVGAGLFACLLARPAAEKRPVQRKPPAQRVAGALQMLQGEAEVCEPLELEIALDGRDLSGRYLLAEAVNIPYVGPNLFLAPDSQPGDGNIDLVLVGEAERPRLTNYLASWQENRERLAVLPSYRGRSLRMRWSGYELHIDDELWPDGEDAAAAPHGAIELAAGRQSVELLAPDPKTPG